MPLSEHEQRLLDQIEQALEAEDPKLASAARSTDLRTVARRRTRYAAGLFILGLVVLVGGVVHPKSLAGIPVIGVIGFLLMFAAALYGFGQYKRASGADLRVVRQGEHGQRGRAARDGRRGTRRTGARSTGSRSAGSRGSIVSRLEQRFLHRFER